MGIAVACKAKFMLKGTAVTSIIILLLLPSLFIFRSCLATSYTGERAFPVLGLSPPTPTTLTSFTTTELRTGQQFIILTNVTNYGELDKAFLAITEAVDSEGVTESIGIVGGLLKVGESTKVGVSWTPLQSGNYQLKSFALSELENPVILATASQSNVVISSTSSNTYVNIDGLYVAPFSNPFEIIGNNTIKLGGSYSVTAEITRLNANFGSEDVSYVLIIQINDKEGRAITSSWHSGTLAVGKSASGGIYWTPTKAGSYTIQSVVLGNLAGTPLSPMQSVNITVIQ